MGISRRYASILGIISTIAGGGPAIDCYRTSSLKYTTNDKALKKLLSTAFENLSNSQLPQSKKAAVQGAANYDKIVATAGKQGFCAMAVKRYGPKGTVLRGLVIERRG